MKLSKQLVFMLLCIFLASKAFSQNVNYYGTDTAYYSVETFMKSDALSKHHYIKIKGKTGVTTLTPDQITDYGFQNGTVYFSKEIEFEGKPKRVFLRRLQQGTLNLYIYKTELRDFYYLEKEGKLIKLNSSDKNYQKQLRELTKDFNWSYNQIDLVKFNQSSLKRIVNRYNYFDNSPLPQFRKGLTVGLRSISFVAPVFQSPNYEFKNGNSVSIGAYTDIPLFQTFFSFYSGLNLSKVGITGIAEEVNIETLIAINLLSVDLPLLLKYTFPLPKWKPYANIGTTLQTNLSKNITALQTSFNGNVVSVLDIDQNDIIQNSLSGFTIGAGVQYPVNNKRLASAEIRYKSLNTGTGRIDQKQLELLISYSF